MISESRTGLSCSDLLSSVNFFLCSYMFNQSKCSFLSTTTFLMLKKTSDFFDEILPEQN